MIYLTASLIVIILLLIISNLGIYGAYIDLNKKRDIEKTNFNAEKLKLLSLISQLTPYKIDATGNVELIYEEQVITLSNN